MKPPLFSRLTLAFMACAVAPFAHTAPVGQAQLEEVINFPTQQVTGVTVSKTGRVFVNFPYWSEDHTVSVLEVLPDGTTKPYPDAAWNSKDGEPNKRFICVQSVYVDAEDTLWILDPAAPMMEQVVPRGPKLVKVDLTKNEVVKTYSFNEKMAPPKSYLNDVRVDVAAQKAFITESGTGAILTLDLKSGKGRRLLARHASTKAEEGIDLVVDGIKVVDPKTDKAPQIHADGIVLDQSGGWLYYHALTGHTLYRVKVEDLLNTKLPREELETKVENVAVTGAPDGMLEAGNGAVYLTNIENNSIVLFDPVNKQTSNILEDPRLQWPDTLAMSTDGHLYITTSQIHRMPKFHDGKSQQKGPYALYRIKLNPPTEPDKRILSPTTGQESNRPAEFVPGLK